MRRLRFLVAVSLLIPLATPARAGGATWEFEDYHRPGDTVVSTTRVTWEHDPGLGTPAEGPYLVYLLENDMTILSWPEVLDQAMLVGVVEVRHGPHWSEKDELSIGPHTAIARFEIPDVPAGIYQIVHCNDPCMTMLGDIVGGWDLRIFPGDSGRPAEEIAADVRAMAPTVPLLTVDRTLAEPKRVISLQVTSLIGSELVLE